MLTFIRKSMLPNASRYDRAKPKHTTKHQRFKLDVEGKYGLLGPTDSYQDLLEIYSEILEKEVKDIHKLTRVEVNKIIKEIGYKLI